MAEPDRGTKAVPEAAGDASRGPGSRTGSGKPGIAGRIRASGPFGWALLALALAAAIVLVVAEFSEISFRTIGIAACDDPESTAICSTTGHESHGYALLILAVLACVMAVGAIVGRSRAAALAVTVIGAAVLAIALGIDQPKLDDTRGLGTRYADVAGHTGGGFKLELIGGVLLILCGGLAMFRAREEQSPREPRSREDRQRERERERDERATTARS